MLREDGGQRREGRREAAPPTKPFQLFHVRQNLVPSSLLSFPSVTSRKQITLGNQSSRNSSPAKLIFIVRPILSVVIPVGNIKKANNMRQPKFREQLACKIWSNPLCCARNFGCLRLFAFLMTTERIGQIFCRARNN